MPSKRNLKTEILQLRAEKKSYREIQKILNCSKGTINYHCRIADIVDIGKKKYPIEENMKKEIAEYCKVNSLINASKAFKVSMSTINNYKNYKGE
jgi:transposase